jgi:hypothetical protein
MRHRLVSSPITALSIGLGLSGILFALEWNVYLPLHDDGFVWYGVWRVSLGELPMRDFQSYDPGRYYWIAAWQWLLRSDVPAMRAADAVFAGVGVAFSVLMSRRVLDRTWQVLLMSGVVTLWFFPAFKPYEPAFALAATWLGARLLERPSLERHAYLGLCVGLGACFGRNIGLYLAVGSFALLLFADRTPRAAADRLPLLKSRLAAWTGGLVVGYLPMLLLVALAPGFLATFAETVREMFASGATNIPAPVPWPWLVETAGLSLVGALRPLVLGTFFVVVPLFCAATLISATIRRGAVEPLWLAATCISAPYLHHAFARADVSHQAAVVPTFLIAALAASATLVPRPAMERRARDAALSAFLVGVAAVTAVSILQHRPLWARIQTGVTTLVPFELDGTTYLIHRRGSRELRTLRTVDAAVTNSGRELLIVPYMPGAYRLLKRRAPVSRLLFMNTASEQLQHRVIRQMESNDVGWVVVSDRPFKGDERYRLSRTYPLLAKYLRDNYRDSGMLPGEQPLRLLASDDSVGVRLSVEAIGVAGVRR